MADSILWQILVKTQERLRRIDFVAEQGDSIKAIARDAIVIRKFRNVGRQQDEANFIDTQEIMPGILITPGERYGTRPAQAGTNSNDDASYPILIQIIAKDDMDRATQANLRTITKWAELIGRAFQNHDFEGTITGDQGQVYIGTAEQTFAPDRSMFTVHGRFQVGVACTFLSREPRGIQ